MLEDSGRVLDVEQDKTDDDGDDKCGENGRLELEFVSSVTTCEDGKELEETEWHVEKGSDSAVEAKALDKGRAENCSN